MTQSPPTDPEWRPFTSADGTPVGPDETGNFATSTDPEGNPEATIGTGPSPDPTWRPFTSADGTPVGPDETGSFATGAHPDGDADPARSPASPRRL